MNDKLIKVDEKFYKKGKVVMLPTEKATKGCIISPYDNKMIIASEIAANNHNNGVLDCNPQHLYILSDEEIKERDWVYNPKGVNTNNKLVKISSSSALLNARQFGWKKIIALTDQSLVTSTITESSAQHNYLPRPSDSFIKKYCELGGIDEVLVEYITTVAELASIEPYRSHPEDLPNYISNPILKVAPDNTITIKSVKNTWNKQELEEIVWKCVNLVNTPKEDTIHTILRNL